MRQLFRQQSGFTLLELAVAGAIGFIVIFGLFSAIRTAGEQAVRTEKKYDQLSLLTDFKYLLDNAHVCERLRFPKKWKVGDEVKFIASDTVTIEKGTVLPVYGLVVTSFKVGGAELIRREEVRRSGRDVWENRRFRMEQIFDTGRRAEERFRPHGKGAEILRARPDAGNRHSRSKKPIPFRGERITRIMLNEVYDYNRSAAERPEFKCLEPKFVGIRPEGEALISGIVPGAEPNEGLNYAALGRMQETREGMAQLRDEKLGDPGGITEMGANFSVATGIERMKRRFDELIFSQAKEKETRNLQGNQELLARGSGQASPGPFVGAGPRAPASLISAPPSPLRNPERRTGSGHSGLLSFLGGCFARSGSTRFRRASGT